MDYTLIYSGRSTIALEVNRNGELLVRAPYGVSRKTAETFLEKNKVWIEKTRAKQLEKVRPQLSETDIAMLKAKAASLLPSKVQQYSNLMGLFPQSVRITGAKTRFGSCSAKNALCFSYLLMQYPDEAVDYVVVHELAHIRYHNHSKDFHRLVAHYLPDAAYRRSLLRK